MTAWIWLLPELLLAAHDELLAKHGGATGLRDANLFHAALARPQNLALYETPDAAALAAAYAFALAKNHPFVDGNKRIALVAMETFLLLNGLELTANDADCVTVIVQLAAGDIEEVALTAWIAGFLRPRRELHGVQGG